MGRSGTQHGELGPSDSSSSGQADLAIRSGTKLTIMRTVKRFRSRKQGRGVKT